MITSEARDEFEALAGIYGEAFSCVQEEGRCQVTVQSDDDGPKLVARFLLPPDYPASCPFVELEAMPREALERDLETLEAQARIFWEDAGGDVILFPFVEFLREQLAQLCPAEREPWHQQEGAPREPADDLAAEETGTSEREARWEELCPEEEEALAAIIEQSIRTDRLAKKAGKARGSGGDTGGDIDIEGRIAARIVHGEPFTERKSTFQGFVCPVESVDEVEVFMALLLENKKIAAATHNMMAFRIDCGKGVWSQDCDDDGEQAAGGRLLHLLQMTHARNVCVVVSRWFGGTLLGPDRFKLIVNCARDVLSENGFIQAGPTGGGAVAGSKKAAAK